MPSVRFLAAILAIGFACFLAPVAQSNPAGSRAPRLEPIAETKLLMTGLAEPNFKGIGKLLKERPKEDEAWEFLRGRALLIAETGNLLMIRPPKAESSQESWMKLAMELRQAASKLASVAGEKSYVPSRAALAGVANACNRCHRQFQATTRVRPFPENEK